MLAPRLSLPPRFRTTSWTTRHSSSLIQAHLPSVRAPTTSWMTTRTTRTCQTSSPATTRARTSRTSCFRRRTHRTRSLSPTPSCETRQWTSCAPSFRLQWKGWTPTRPLCSPLSSALSWSHARSVQAPSRRSSTTDSTCPPSWQDSAPSPSTSRRSTDSGSSAPSTRWTWCAMSRR